jgi:hypothetical protein
MATDKQIAANQANALRSTGPKTTAGKLKSSRNAYRHGLSGEMPLDPAVVKIASIVHELVGEKASEDRLTSAIDFSHAQARLLQIRSIRAEQLARDLNDFNRMELRRLAALYRYERYALTKRRRASKKLDTTDDEKRHLFAKTNPI